MRQNGIDQLEGQQSVMGVRAVLSFDAARLAQAFAIVERGIAQGAYPGAVAAVGGMDGVAAVRAFGLAVQEPEQLPMRTDTLFDLASLTKVVAATPALLRLLEDGAFVLETPVRQMIPEFGDDRVTMRHLLTHTSGLPAWCGLYLDHRGWEAYTAAICATELLREPGTAVAYSDLGFMLLGAVIQRLTGQTLPDYCRTAIFEPLGMHDTGWLPAQGRQRIAATERGNQVEYGMCGDRAPGFSRWRRAITWGEANDGNCFYGLDGVSSHAGLFGTAADMARYAQAWLRGGRPVLGRHTVALATRSHTPAMADNRALGWQKPPAAAFPSSRASCGDMLSPQAFGHTGFTGTSLWIDPDKDLFMILLTNRLHPAAKDGLFAVRPAFHNAVVAALR
ncbi:MAG: beta-lactamase [Firmicutes bacterium]|nr:beta-lactamase [Bacillota bacterium]